MRRHRLREVDDDYRAILPTFANKEGDVDLKGLAQKAYARKQRAEEERRREEQRAAYRRKYKDLFNALDNAKDLDDKEDILFRALVPSKGAAPTVAGEIIRAISKIRWRDYNDGDIFYAGYGLETAGGPAEYLYQNTNDIIRNDIEDIVRNELYNGRNDNRYTDALNHMLEDIIDFIEAEPEMLYEPNEEDMLDYEPDDILTDVTTHEFDCDFGYFAYNIIDNHSNSDAIYDIEDWLEDFIQQNTANGELEHPYRDSYIITNLDIVDLDNIERRWDRFASDLDRYLESEYDTEDDDYDDDEEYEEED